MMRLNEIFLGFDIPTYGDLVLRLDLKSWEATIMHSNCLYFVTLLAILFILVGCPTEGDDDDAGDDDAGDDDAGDDDAGDDDTGDDDGSDDDTSDDDASDDDANKVLDYGFEDWGGDIASTPGYIFTSGYTEYCVDQAEATEVITSYNGWTPHSGNYFWLQNDSPTYALDPAVNGITAGSVQAANNIGAAGDACGDDSFKIDEDIDTGEIFIRFWARNNSGFATIQDGGRCKWIVITTDGGGAVYMHLSTSSIDPGMYFYHGDEGYWLGDAVTLPNAYDGNWHKYSLYINFNSGTIRGWYDVANETAENATKEWIADDGQIGSCTEAVYAKIQGNFSAKYPTEETYHALDDLEIWDGMP